MSSTRDGNIQDHVTDAKLFDLVEELTHKIRAGGQVDIDAFFQEHPAHAERLQRLSPTLQALDALNSSWPGNEQSSGQVESPDEVLHANLQHPGAFRDFRILREMGRGGMGVVFEAEQLSLGRRVALKILPFAALLYKHQLERFATEVTAAARLQHSNIVQVYTVGCERGIHFYAMQLIDGPSLADVIVELRRTRHTDKDATAFPPSGDMETVTVANPLTMDAGGEDYYRAVARVGREAAEALHYAHENGVLHRDIKPSNVLLDKTGHVWIADFGLARVEGESQLTRTGDVLGTLRYMSPEQATGQRDHVDARSDVYGLGATLYELATLQPVFDGEGRRQIIKQVVARAPVAPHKIDHRIPRPLSLIISRAMARRPDERYQSAQELAEDLQRFLNRQPVLAKPETCFGRGRAIFRRHRVACTTTAILLITVLVLTSYRHPISIPPAEPVV